MYKNVVRTADSPDYGDPTSYINYYAIKYKTIIIKEKKKVTNLRRALPPEYGQGYLMVQRPVWP